MYRCRFGGAEVNATYGAEHDELECISPVAVAGIVTVAISLNAQQFSLSGAPFEYYEDPSISHLLPSAGPIEGGTSITVFGAGFSRGADYRCKFHGGNATIVHAEMEDDARVACVVPAAPCGPGACAAVVRPVARFAFLPTEAVPPS